MSKTNLTAAQQDYLEAIYRLEESTEGGSSGARITDIAGVLGTRLPTVVRNIGRLKELRLVTQRERGPVILTKQGRRLAGQLAHRHEDVVELLTSVLGVEPGQAETEACFIEHGLSGATSERLHGFLLCWSRLSGDVRRKLTGCKAGDTTGSFTLVGRPTGKGGRH